jgi:hypothetical protein
VFVPISRTNGPIVPIATGSEVEVKRLSISAVVKKNPSGVGGGGYSSRRVNGDTSTFLKKEKLISLFLNIFVEKVKKVF